MKSHRFISASFLSLATLLSVGLAARADVKLPALFSDHAVLQQGVPIKVWGWAEPNEVVTVEFRQQKVTAKTPATGRWMVTLKAEKAGEPDTLKVSGRNTLVVNDVLVGEVWVASGQSNMEFTMKSSFQSAADIAASANPMIRHFNVARVKADQPQADVKGTWQVAGPETTAGFSAVGYYFSRDLQKALKTPVGVIHTSWGGSPAEVWMSEETLAASPEYKRDILDTYAAQRQKYEETVASWEKDKAAAEKEGKPFNRQRPWPTWKPTELYNAMIAPLIPYNIKGAIWYQGESNAGRAWQYRTLYADMIRNWRKAWGLGDFAFLGVQIAPWDKSRKRSLEEITAAPVESDWAELREAQVLSTKVLKNCGLAVITDVGDKDDIHPTKKEPVGARLALLARQISYGEKIVASGPAFKSMKTKDGKAILSFDHAAGGLESRGGALTGFAICGEDRKFVWAKAEIQGEKVEVSSPQVAKPVAVRFGWADFPVVNLFNKAGLPASPFRTDDFPMTTAPKKSAAGQ
jgi:sialate O-acetylesterase